jgi:nitric oxide reductase subunit B
MGESFMDVQDQLAIFYWIRLGSGFAVLISAVMFIWAVLVPGKQKQGDVARLAQPAE